MSTYKAPLTDIRFALYDVLGAEALFAKLGYGDATRDVLDAVLDEAARFTETVLAPLNSVGDEIGCGFDKATGDVTTPPGFQQAYSQFIEGGWTGLTAAPEHGDHWHQLVQVFLTGARAAAALGQAPARLAEEVEPGVTLADELNSVAVHNAYHFGKIVALRQRIGAWPPRASDAP